MRLDTPKVGVNGSLPALQSSDTWDDVSCEGILNSRSGLHVWGQNLGVFREVEVERITGPSSFGLHHLEGYPSEEVLEGGPDPNSVAL